MLAFLLLSCSIIFFSFVHSLCLSVHSLCLSIDGLFLLWPMSFSSLPRVFVIFGFIHYPKFLSTLCFFLVLSVCLSLSINFLWCYLSSQLSFLAIFIRSLRLSPTSLVSKDNSVHICLCSHVLFPSSTNRKFLSFTLSISSSLSFSSFFLPLLRTLSLTPYDVCFFFMGVSHNFSMCLGIGGLSLIPR